MVFHGIDDAAFERLVPKEYLPDYFEAWNRLSKSMPDLVMKHEMRNSVRQVLIIAQTIFFKTEEMPLLDHCKLTGYRQHRLAHFQLAIITAGYVWQEGDDEVTQRLPKCVAVPFWKISEYLGIKPIISHPDLCLANWKYTSDEQSDIECLNYAPPGAEEAHWFCKVTVLVELAFARGLNTMQCILDCVVEDDKVKVTRSLDDLTVVVGNMMSALQKMHDHLSADTFYNVVRPFLGGWGGANNPLPDGLIYEGISEEPVKCIGGSAAQSSTFQFLDILLGVSHQPDKLIFLNEMRNYMPPAHKQLLEDMENMPRTLRHMVNEHEDKDLWKAYNKCVDAVIKFRTYHIQIVTKYIVVASRKKNNYESLSSKGTGGTDLLPFLKELRDDTEKKML